MKDDELLNEARMLAESHPMDELALKFLQALCSENRDLKNCLALAARIVLKYA